MKKLTALLHRIPLSVGLLIIVLISMLPMNLLLIVASNSAVHNAEDILLETYSNEFFLLEEQLALLEDGVNNEYSTAVTESWSTLLQPEKFGLLEQQNLINNLRQIWQRQTILQGAFLKMDQAEFVYLTYDSEDLSITQRDQITESILAADTSLGQFSQQIIRTEDGSYYWIWSQGKTGYSWGFFVSFDALMDRLGLKSSRIGSYYIVERDGVLLAASGDDAAAGEVWENAAEGYFSYSTELGEIDCQLIWNIPSDSVQQNLPVTARLLQIMAIAMIVMIPIVFLAVWLLVLRPLKRFHAGMEALEQDRIDFRLEESRANTREFVYLYAAFNHMAEQLKSLRIQKYEMEIEKLETESENLRLQVNPHLLLNSLNMICSLAKLEDFRTIEQYTRNLAEYFRYVLRRTEELVPVSAELNFVKRYLEIQKVRFPGSFTCVYEVEDGMENVMIPALVIQNIVENSVKYALKLGSEIEIIILIRRDEEKLVISVIDTGNGMDADTLATLNNGEVFQNKTGKHIGLWNLRRRLRLYYDGEAEMTITSAPNQGTQTWIRLPIRTAEHSGTVNGVTGGVLS